MAQRGPKPTPTKVLQLRGSWRAKKRPKEPISQAALPPIPRWLDADSKRLWRKLTADLHATGLLSRLDGFALARYCAMSTQWQRMQAFIEAHGLTYETKRVYHAPARVDADGESIPSHRVEVTTKATFPQVKLWLQLADRLVHMEQSFGMSPSARASLGVELSKAREPTPAHPLTDSRRFLRLDRAD